MTQPTRTISSPARTPETIKYWDAANEGKLLIKICLSCGETHHYPRSICPFCFSKETEWKISSGRGVIYSYSVMRRTPIPYVIAYVTLEEGPTMLTNIVDCDFDKLSVGQNVKLINKTDDSGNQVPMFTTCK